MYPPGQEDHSALDSNDLVGRFRFYPATTPEKAQTHQRARELCLDLACELDKLAPDCREKSLSITRLEEALMWANAAIARHAS